jgi:hypothetical protein
VEGEVGRARSTRGGEEERIYEYYLGGKSRTKETTKIEKEVAGE